MDPNNYERKTVLVVYSRDSAQHYEVVHQLVHFLERRCKVRVDVDYNSVQQIAYDRAEYIMNSITRADKVLLIISDGIRQRWTSPAAAAAATTAASVDDDPDDQLVNKYLSLLRIIGVEGLNGGQSGGLEKKLIAVRFDYTAADVRIDWHNSFHRPIYELMRDVDRMVMDLHDVPESQSASSAVCSWRLPVWYGQRYVLCSEGAKLDAAIKTMKQSTPQVC